MTWGGGEVDAIYAGTQVADGYVFAGSSLSTNGGNLTVTNVNNEDWWMLHLASRVAPVGTPAVLVNGRYSPVNQFTLTTTNTILVSLTNTLDHGFLFYTTDGSDPTLGNIYGGPFMPSQTTSLRAIATDAFFTPLPDTEMDPVLIQVLPLYPLPTATSGGGLIALDPPTGPYLSNTTVTLTGIPTNGWDFLRWEGDAAGTNEVLQLTMDQARSVRAVFGTTVNLISSSQGVIALSPALDHYDFGTTLRLSAVPTNGTFFRFWGGAATGLTNNPQTFVITNPSPTFTAVYGGLAPGRYALSVIPVGGGTVLLDPDLLTNYASGATVDITAVPDPGRAFAGWSGDASGNANPLGVTMNSSLVITSRFTAPPAVVITSPTDGAEFGAEGFTVVANASDPDGSISGVTFFRDGVELGSDASAPYEQSVSGLANGNYLLTARATDNLGAMALSAPVSITITSAFPPSVSIDSPTHGAAFVGPTNILVEITAEDMDGTIDQVNVYAGTNLIGTLTNAPYALTWSNVLAGSYQVSAVAFDNSGLITTSAPVDVTVTIPPGPPAFSLSMGAYFVSEDAGFAVITINKSANSLAGSVNFATDDIDARAAGTGLGDYRALTGSASFQAEQLSTNILVELIDDISFEGNQSFLFTLSNPGGGGSLDNPFSASVTIVDDDPPASTNSLTDLFFPGAAPQANGSLTVTLLPVAAGGQWRFSWEAAWRNSGSTASGLVPGGYPTEFRPAAGFEEPAPALYAVSAGGADSVTNYYVETEVPKFGGLFVTIGPSNVANHLELARRGQWRLQGEATWRDSGDEINPILEGLHIVEFKAILEHQTPPPRVVRVVAEQQNGLSATYFASPPAPGSPPGVLSSFSSIASGLNLGFPYAFNGQFLTDAGYASGFVVRRKVVLTAAHVVFNDVYLSYVSQAHWFFQRHRGEYEPIPQTPRGWYVFEGYAAQREMEGTPGVSSSASQNLDVAAVYFLEDAGRGGFGGYLSSDEDPNEWLISSNPKMLIGYPVESVPSSDQGKMHRTTPDNIGFTKVSGHVYATTGIKSYPGNSGGPLCVQITTGNDSFYYPAAVYLGGSGQTVVRAINGEVVGLINRADVSANTGDNNTGGGVITIALSGTTPGGGPTPPTGPGFVQVVIKPLEAVAADAGWRLGTDGDYVNDPTVTIVLDSSQTNALQFREIVGWNLPTNQTVIIVPNQLSVITALYTVPPPLLQFDDDRNLILLGTTGTTYRLEQADALNHQGTDWVLEGQVYLTNSPQIVVPGGILPTGPIFYHVVWIP